MSIIIRISSIRTSCIVPVNSNQIGISQVGISQVGIIGSIFLEMVYHVEDGDKLSLDQETLGHWKDSPGGESSEYKEETTYWLTIERSNGNLVKTVLGDDVLLGSKNQVSDIKKFILSHS